MAQKLNGAIGLHQNKESIYRSKPGNVLPFCHSLKSEPLMKLLPTCTGIIAVIKPPVTWEKFDLPGLRILSCDLTAPKLSRNDEWQLSIHTFCWGRKYTQISFSVKRSQSCIFDEPNDVLIYTQGKKYFFQVDKSHKLTLRTLTLNKEGVKKERENIGGGQECGSSGGEIAFIKAVATFVRFCWRS